MRWKKDVYNIEYAIMMSIIKCPSLCVIDRLINSYDDKYVGCRNCTFRDTSIEDEVSCLANVTEGKESVLR